MAKEYVLLSRHYGANGNVYQKGDKIRLTEQQATNLANKVIDAKDALIKSEGNGELIKQVDKLNKELEAVKSENENLAKQLVKLNKDFKAVKAENKDLTKQLDEATSL